jgi:hypothetical protein
LATFILSSGVNGLRKRRLFELAAGRLRPHPGREPTGLAAAGGRGVMSAAFAPIMLGATSVLAPGFGNSQNPIALLATGFVEGLRRLGEPASAAARAPC